jgi:hypothetical protein
MADEAEPGKTHPVLRLLAGVGCLVFLALAVLFFPIYADGLWNWSRGLLAPFGAVVGAVYCGKIAVTGRASRRP